MFGRKSSATTSSATTSSLSSDAGVPADASSGDQGKGRPTPKRRESERGRRRAITAPRNRKEAVQQARERQRGERGRQLQALKAGDERMLPPRDRGPVRKYVRDLVDARRSVAEFFLPLAVVILLLTWFGSDQMKLFGGTLWLVLVVLIVVDSVVLIVRLRRGLQRSLPDEPHRGATSYALMRSMQMRRFRLPPPRMKSRGVRMRRN